jgi:hypothetical protein
MQSFVVSNSLAGRGLARPLGMGRNNGLDDPFPLNMFQSSGGQVGVQREWSASGGSFSLLQHLGNDRYWRVTMAGTLSVGGEFLRIGSIYLSKLWAGINSANGATFSGTWTHDPNNSYGGGMRDVCPGTIGAYMEVTTAPGVTSVGVQGLKLNIGGMYLVTIDGDKTLADQVTTAQQLVDIGVLVSTALVANGGTLNPTDRVLDTYSSSAIDYVQIFTASLPPGIHVLRLTNLNYKNNSATNKFLYINRLLAFGPGAYNLTQSNPYFETLANIYAAGGQPVWEISYNTKPSGATSYEWVGHTGSLKFITLPAITVNGASKTLAIGEIAAGSEVNIAMQFGIRHSQINAGGTDIGALDFAYNLKATTGLTISHHLVWSMTGVTNGYPGMMAVSRNPFDRFATLAASVGADLTAADGSFHFGSRDQMAYCWDYDGNLGALMYIPDLEKTVEGWRNTTNYQLNWADIMDPGWKKAYAFRYEGDHAFVNGEAIDSEINYRVQWFEQGANAVLSTANGH